MLETELWKKVRLGVADGWRAHRIENKLDSGTPDVFFVLHHHGNLAGMIELKIQAPNKSDNLVCRHYTQEQRDFAKTFRTVFLLLHTGNEYMLFDHSVAYDILLGGSVEWHRSITLYHSVKPDWSKLVDVIRRHLTSPEFQLQNR